LSEERLYDKALSAAAKGRRRPVRGELKAEETADMQIWTARPTGSNL